MTHRVAAELAGDAIALPAMVLSERACGVAKSKRGRENDQRLAVFLQAPITVRPFDADGAREAGEIRAALAKTGKPIGRYDILIAAQARRRGATRAIGRHLSNA